MIGDSDVLLGEIERCPCYIDARLHRAWHEAPIVLDVIPGAPEGFSLPAGDGLTFVSRQAPVEGAER